MTTLRNANAPVGRGADTSNNFANRKPETGVKQAAKRLIVGAAVWGLISASFATWLLLRVGLVSE